MNCRRIYRSTHWSLHAEGRALDWRLSVHKRSERRAAGRLVALLLAPDRHGHPNALALRMGLQEVIWNCRIWLSDAGTRTEPYGPCRRRNIDDTHAHRNHVHLGLSWQGARMRTSFWRHFALRAG